MEQNTSGPFHVAGNMHMHTPYSDGEKWHADVAVDAIKAGLDFIIVTDHNVWVDGVEGYYEHEGGRVLLLVGEEVHDTRREPQANHFLVYGAEKEMYIQARNPQELINAVNEAGGFGFIAHPFDPAAPLIHEPDLAWHDWDIEGFTGLEIWNYMSNFKQHLTTRLTAAQAVFNPQKFICGPIPAALEKWDELLAQGKRVTAVGNSDAHGTLYPVGPWKRVVFPYEFLFRAVNTHLALKEPLNGDLAHDKALILQAVGRGNSWVGYDMAHPTKGFRFSGQSLTKGIMGDEIKMDAGATLQVKAPANCHIRLLRHGKTVAEVENDAHLTHIPIETGAYRAECYIRYEGKPRGWIFSNPIYLR